MNMRKGRLFEMAPDGFGYLIDRETPAETYVVDAATIAGLLPRRLEELEGRSVSFRLKNGQPVAIALELAAAAQA